MKKTIYIVIISLFFLSCQKELDRPNEPPIITIIDSNHIYSDSATNIYLGGGYTNDLYALNAITGKVIWNKKISGLYSTSAIYSKGVIILKGYDGYMHAFDTLGNIKWNLRLLGNLSSNPSIPMIVDAGTIYDQDNEYIYAIESTTGVIKWSYLKTSIDQTGSGTLVFYNNTLYCENFNGSLLAVDAITGTLKWKYYMGSKQFAPIVFADNIYILNGANYHGNVEVHDIHTGAFKWTNSTHILSRFNLKYGKIFSADGQVLDSATATNVFPSMQFPLSNNLPDDSRYPILADSLAMMPGGVADASTGMLVCKTPNLYYTGGATGAEYCGATYLNHVLYYTTNQIDVYNPYSGARYYSHVYAFDVMAKKLLWVTQIENANFFSMEPCVVSKSGKVYRGSYTFQ